jgi:hypothetical protein
MVWTILGLACIVLAFVGEIVDERLLLGTLEMVRRRDCVQYPRLAAVHEEAVGRGPGSRGG